MKSKFVIPVCFIVLTCYNGCVQVKVPSSERMNILFIALDDLRPTLGCYHDSLAISPNIDKLASMGIVFNRAYCQQAICNPSRASILTGLRPDEEGVTDLATYFREVVPKVVTLPQLFKDNGYVSVDIGKIFHGTKSTQDTISWSVPALYDISVKEEEYYLPRNKVGKKAASFEAPDIPDSEYVDGKIANRGIEWLKEFKASGKSFFLALGFKKPHLPFCAPKHYWDLYNKEKLGLGLDSAKPIDAPQIAFHHWQELRGYNDIPKEGDLTPEKDDTLRWAYYSCVSYVDAQIGKVIQTLHDLDLDKNTIIVLLGDHGYHLGEQHLWAKSTNFELDNRIPLIISAPGIAKNGKSTNAIVEALDIYPTLIDLCNIKPATSLQGISLKSILMDPDKKWNRAAYSQFISPYGALFSKFSKKAKYMGYSVRTKEWRCTAWYNLKTGSVDYKELYDLKDSNIEQINLAGNTQYATIETHLLQMLDHYKNKNYEK